MEIPLSMPMRTFRIDNGAERASTAVVRESTGVCERDKGTHLSSRVDKAECVEKEEQHTIRKGITPRSRF